MNNLFFFPSRKKLKPISVEFNPSWSAHELLEKAVRYRKDQNALNEVISVWPSALEALLLMTEWVTPMLPSDGKHGLLTDIVVGAIQKFRNEHDVDMDVRIRAFILGMIDHTPQLMSMRVYVLSDTGVSECWNRFSEPLAPWLRARNAKKIYIEPDCAALPMEFQQCRLLMAYRTVPPNYLKLIHPGI